MSCHSQESTLSIGDKRPATISHPHFSNSTQCHVPANPGMIGRMVTETTPTEDNWGGRSGT